MKSRMKIPCQAGCPCRQDGVIQGVPQSRNACAAKIMGNAVALVETNGPITIWRAPSPSPALRYQRSFLSAHHMILTMRGQHRQVHWRWKAGSREDRTGCFFSGSTSNLTRFLRRRRPRCAGGWPGKGAIFDAEVSGCMAHSSSQRGIGLEQPRKMLVHRGD